MRPVISIRCFWIYLIINECPFLVPTIFIIIDWKIFPTLSLPVLLLVTRYNNKKMHGDCDEYLIKNLGRQRLNDDNLV